MKTRLLLLPAIAAILLLNSCGTNYAMMMNQNQNSTQVHLASANFRVVDRVHGHANVPYVFGIGGMSRSQLYEQAYSAMMERANLKEGSRALIDLVTEEHVGGVFPIYFKRTITVSGNVVEFNR